jgi:hypothetical protein
LVKRASANVSGSGSRFLSKSQKARPIKIANGLLDFHDQEEGAYPFGADFMDTIILNLKGKEKCARFDRRRLNARIFNQAIYCKMSCHLTLN